MTASYHRAMRLALAVMVGAGAATILALALQGCGASLRQSFRAASNATADAANAAGRVTLERYCVAQLRALHRTGSYTGGRCVADGEAAHETTDAERAELARVRAAWRPVMRAHAVLRHAHDALRAGLDAADGARDGDLPRLIADVVEAYRALIGLAKAVGLDLPAMPNGMSA